MVHNKYDKTKENLILSMYKEGHTQKHITDVLGTFNTTICRILIRNNVSLRGNREIHIPKSKIPRITITSKSKVLLYQIKDYLVSIGIYSSIVTHKTGVMDLVMSNKVNTSKFLKHIYHDANISLNRKLLLATPYL